MDDTVAMANNYLEQGDVVNALQSAYKSHITEKHKAAHSTSTIRCAERRSQSKSIFRTSRRQSLTSSASPKEKADGKRSRRSNGGPIRKKQKKSTVGEPNPADPVRV